MKKPLISSLVIAMLALTPITAMNAAAEETTTADTTKLACTDTQDLTIVATTDTHGTALNYNYFTGEPFGSGGEKMRNKTRGMELLSTAISDIRTEKGADSVLLLDNGDANQGNPLETVYHANRTATDVDPMASVLNYLKYDAGVVGNHEFNYGYLDADGKLGDLHQYAENLDMPLLAANVIDRATGKSFMDPYTMITKTVAGHEVKIGVIGVVTPGIRIWDASRVKNLEFKDPTQVVQQLVPEVKQAGADIVVVLAHTGLDADTYKWNAADLSENTARSIAENTSGVDVIVAGHSHVTDQYDRSFTNAEGKRVLLTQPGYHARFLSEVSVPLTFTDGKATVVNSDTCHSTVTPVYAADYVGKEDPQVEKVIDTWHQRTLKWVSTVVGTATEDMSAATSAWEDTPIVDFINMVQTQTVTDAIKGTQYEGLPVVSEASPFSRTAVFKKGEVTIADMAALYVYDNTLLGVELTGAQLKDYLEWSARYYTQQEAGAEISDWSTVTNALYPGQTRGLPDYAYDELSGVNYHINISQPVGQRIENLTYPDGKAVGADDHIILAINNYRQSGGSGYPHVADAPVVYDQLASVRDLMIEWAQTNKTIDPNTFFTQNWTVSTTAATVAPPATATPTAAPSASAAPTSAPVTSAPAAQSASAKAVAQAKGTQQLAHTGVQTLPAAGIGIVLLLVGLASVCAKRRCHPAADIR